MQWLLDNDDYDLPNERRPVCHHDDHSYVSMYGRLQLGRACSDDHHRATGPWARGGTSTRPAANAHAPRGGATPDAA